MGKMTNQELLEYIKAKCPGKYVNVFDCKAFGGDIFQAFVIAQSNYLINGVSGQYPEVISMRFRDGVREYQIFGGNGGQYIHRKIDKTKEDEKYLALGLEKMPAIRTKDYKKAIDKACDAYNKIIFDISSRGLTYGL